MQNETFQVILKEMENRRASDPLRLFEPFSRQREFIDSILHAKWNTNFYLGANRSGKSDAGAYTVAQLARFGYPDDSPLAAKPARGKGSSVTVRDRATSGWVSCLSYPTARDVMMPKIFNNGFVPPSQHPPFIPEREIERFFPDKNILKLRNGSMIGFRSADSGREKYQGSEKDYVHIDEEHPEAIIDEITIRVGSRPLNIFHTCTLFPDEKTQGGITWMYRRYIKPFLEGKQVDWGIYNASIYDNPHIPDAEKRRLEAIYPPGSIQRRVRLNGELIAGMTLNRAYPAFDRELHVDESIEPASRYEPICWNWDFNVAPSYTCLSRDGGDSGFGSGYKRSVIRHEVFDEIFLEEGSIADMVDVFRQRYPSHPGGVRIYGDAYGHMTSQHSRQSSYELIVQYMRGYPSPVTLHVPQTNPSPVMRVDSMNYALKDERGAVHIKVHPRCVELIDDFEQVQSDGRGAVLKKKMHSSKDPYLRRTHMTDALGYRVTASDPIVAASSRSSRHIVLPVPSYRK